MRRSSRFVTASPFSKKTRCLVCASSAPTGFCGVLLSRWWPGWRRSLHIVRPDTVIGWHRRAFAWYWTRKSRQRPGRRNVPAEIRDLIRNISQANPLWGAPRIHGELLKLGIEVAQSTVANIFAAEATFPDVANLLDQSYGPDGLHRLLCGPDGDLPGSVCVRCVIACAAPRAALPVDRPPQPGVDNAAGARSVSLRPWVQISSARPRCHLWP